MRDHYILLGRDLHNDNPLWLLGGEHAILQGRSGTGKSVGCSIPNAFTWPGSLVCLDIKRELFATTAGWRRSQGQDVFLFDPTAEDGRSHRWNPFWQVDRSSLVRFNQISRMAFQIWPEVAGPNTANADFWNGTARAAFCAFAGLIAETPSASLTMGNVLRLFVRNNNKALERLVKRRIYSPEVRDGIHGYIRKYAQLGDSIRESVTTRLQIWSNPHVVAATNETDFDLREIRRRAMSIYIGVPPGDIPRNAPLLRLLFDALLSVNTTTLPEHDPSLTVPVLLMLDEFPQLGRMDRLTHALEYVRGFGLRMLLIVQNRPQVMDAYGPYAAASIFDNVGAEMIYGTSDEKLAEQVEKRVGNQTVQVVTGNQRKWFPSLNWSSQTTGYHPHPRPVVLRQEVLQMPMEQQIILRQGMRPIVASKIRWWEEAEFRDRWLPPPHIPQLRVVVP